MATVVPPLLSEHGPSEDQPVHSGAPSYGPQNIRARISERHRAVRPAMLGPVHPPVYPVRTRFVDPGIKPEALRVHPRGFKVLSAGSPIDRRITSYFRLPPRPSRKAAAERIEYAKKAEKIVAAERRAAGGNGQGVILDGFMLLAATGAKDPSDATEAIINDSYVVGAVEDDLGYFTNLTFLDLGENRIHLTALAGLTALEEVHLHCNLIRDLSGLDPVVAAARKFDAGAVAATGVAASGRKGDERPRDDDVTVTKKITVGSTDDVDGKGVRSAAEAASRQGAFPSLHTLNLSFNQIDPVHLAYLAHLPSLVRLDVSHNRLLSLPDDLSMLASLKQVALEDNGFSSPDVLHALGTLPALEEVNLSHNGFQQWPQLKRDTDFPALRVLGLAANQFTYFEDLYPLRVVAASVPSFFTDTQREKPAAGLEGADEFEGTMPAPPGTAGTASNFSMTMGTEIRPLQRVILWGNPIELRPKDRDIVVHEFDAIGVQVVMETPMPPKRTGRDFCQFKPSTTAAPMAEGGAVGIPLVTIAPVDAKGLDRDLTKRSRRAAAGSQRPDRGGQDVAASQPPTVEPVPPAAADGSFFVTQPTDINASGGGINAATAATTKATEGAGRQTAADRTAASNATPSWFSAARPGSQQASLGGTLGSSVGRQDVSGISGSALPSIGGRRPPSDAAHPPSSSHPTAHPSLDRLSAMLDDEAPEPLGGDDDGGPLTSADICRPNATARSILGELKRTLRQPLPPMYRPRLGVLSQQKGT